MPVPAAALLGANVEIALRSPATGAGRPRPRLLFVRPATGSMPAYIAIHFDEQVCALSQFFDVTVVPPEGDYAELCDKHRPDLALFESGVYFRGPRRLFNTNVRPDIPKIGFLNSDAYCPTRRAFLSDMDHLGIETYFTLSVSMAEHTPEIADRLFIWPNSINREVYRDYGEKKNIPVLLTGSRAIHYPWRNQIMDIIPKEYPVMRTPHFGWVSRQRTSRMVHGEQYARLINASFVAPTCGTIAHEVVRKHFEIPGCRTCLVTESTPGLAAAGFVDMENCVFVEPDDALDKLAYLFANPDRLQAITDRGHALVHERHSWSSRTQIYDWFLLHRSMRPGQRIIQPGPFAQLTLVDDAQATNGHVSSGGPYSSLLRQAADLLEAGDHPRSERAYLQCLNYHDSAPEPYLGVALCALHRGDAPRALEWLHRLLHELDDCMRADPDPVEWAYYIIALLCAGDVRGATSSAALHPALNHPELARTRLALAGLAPGLSFAGPDDAPAARRSVHSLPARSDGDWFDRLAAILRACGQNALAERLPRHGAVRFAAQPGRIQAKADAAAPPSGDRRFRRGDPLLRRLRRHVLRTLADPAYPARFLASQARPDPFADLIATEVVDSTITSILLVTSRHWSASSHALLTGLRRNPSLPTMLRVGSAGSLTIDAPLAASLELPPPIPGAGLRQAMNKRDLQSFDLILIDGVPPPDFDDEVLDDAGVILLDRLDLERNHLIARRLHQPHSGYEVISCSAEHNGGYAAFKRRSAVADAPPRLEAVTGVSAGVG